MVKKLACLLLGIMIWGQSAAQQYVTPYKLTVAVDVPVASYGLSIMAASYLIGRNQTLPPRESLINLDRMEVNRFDRRATYQSSKGAKIASDVLLYTAMASPLLQLANKNSRKDFGRIAAISAESMVLDIAVTNFVKEIVRRKRPLMYNPDFPIERKYKADNFKSFFSGHTSVMATMSFLYAKSYADYNPKSKLKPMVWSISAALPLVMGILRYKAGKHYWTDVIVGYVVGAAIGFGVPYLHSSAVSASR